MTRAGLVRVLFCIWILTFWSAFAAAYLAEPTGDGFVRGLNRIRLFLQIHTAAALLGVVIWGLGRPLDGRTWSGRLSRIPLICAGALIAVFAGLFLYLLAGSRA